RCYRDWSSDVCSSDLSRSDPSIMTKSSRSSSPPASSSPGDAMPDVTTDAPASVDPRDATRGGVNGPALPGQSPVGGKSPLLIDRSEERRVGSEYTVCV